MWAYLIPAIVLALVLGVYGLSCLLFHLVIYRPGRSTKIPKSYVDTPHYKVSRAGMAYMQTVPVEDAYLTSRDGLRLHAYLYPGPQGVENKKFILGIHGYRSYARPEFGPYIRFYHSLGYSLLLPDDRAHRPSQGKYIGLGVLDRLDCVDWANYLVRTYGRDTEIRLHGVSMGGATVLAASGQEDLPEQVRGIVADCGYTSVWEIFTYQLKHSMHLPVWPFLPLSEKICKHRAGYGFREHTPLEQVQKARVPVLFVQGMQDQMVPAFMVQKLYDACSAPKRLLTVEEAGHAESIALAPDRYHAAIHEFFGI